MKQKKTIWLESSKGTGVLTNTQNLRLVYANLQAYCAIHAKGFAIKQKMPFGIIHDSPYNAYAGSHFKNLIISPMPVLWIRTYFFGSGFNLNFGSGSGFLWKIHLYCRSSDHLNIAKKQIFKNLYISGSGLLMKNTYELQIIYVNITKKQFFFNLSIFTALYLLVGIRIRN
jgi:hypothetical protein